jgi:lysozyme family protein
MAIFITAYRITKENEGGYHNSTGDNAADRGGETFKGIARNIHPSWRGWSKVDAFKSKPGFPDNALNNAEINSDVLWFYKLNFWDPMRLDELNDQAIANDLFDTGVNMGASVPARFLQRAINYLNRNERDYRDISVDGRIGDVTLGLVNRMSQNDRRHVFNLINILQGARYIEIIERNPTQEVFIRGWLERVELMKRV